MVSIAFVQADANHRRNRARTISVIGDLSVVSVSSDLLHIQLLSGLRHAFYHRATIISIIFDLSYVEFSEDLVMGTDVVAIFIEVRR